jgi:hypothetical protein
MRFYGWGAFAVDINTTFKFDKHARLTLGSVDFRLDRTNRRGEPTKEEGVFRGSGVWRISAIRTAYTFRTPLYWSRAVDNVRFPTGVFLDMGPWVSSLAIFTDRSAELLTAWEERGVRVDREVRRMAPLIFRRQRRDRGREDE